MQSARTITLEYVFFFSYVPLKFVNKVLWQNHVRSITLKPFKISSWNCIQILTNIRQHAECKNHNSCIDTLWVTSLWSLYLTVSVTKSCPLYNFKTVQDMSIKFHTSITVSIIRRCAEHNNHNSWICIFFLLFPFERVRISSVTKSCLCLTWKPLKISSWNFIQILRIIRRCAEHKNHNSCLYSFKVIPL